MAPPSCLTQKCHRNSVAQSLPADPATKWEIADHRRRKDSLQRIGEPDLDIHPSGVLRLIDTRPGSLKGHYVNAIMLRTSPRSSSIQPAASLLVSVCRPLRSAGWPAARTAIFIGGAARRSHQAQVAEVCLDGRYCFAARHCLVVVLSTDRRREMPQESIMK